MKKHFLFLIATILAVASFSQNTDSLISKYGLWVEHYKKSWIDANLLRGSSYTAGKLIFSNGALTTSTNANLHWDNSNSRLGLGTAVPTHALTVGSTNMVTNAGLAFYSTADQTTNYQRLRLNITSGNVVNYDLEAGGTGSLGYHSFNVGGTAVLQVDALQAIFGGNLLVTAGAGDNTKDIGRLSANPFRFRSIYLGTSLQVGAAANTAIAARLHLGASTASLPSIRYITGADPTTPTDGDVWFNGGLKHYSSIILNNTATNGLVVYNTSDQTTNYERLRTYAESNVFNIRSENLGTGVARSMIIGTSSRTLTIVHSPNNTGGFQFSIGSGNANAAGVVYTGAYVANSGINAHHVIAPTQNGGGTSGYTANLVSVYEQNVGSGLKNLLDLGTRSAAYPSGTHSSKFKVSSTGKLTIGDVPEYTDNAAALSGGLTVGDVYRTGDALKIVH